MDRIELNNIYLTTSSTEGNKTRTNGTRFGKIIDNEEALRQAIIKLLSTQRGVYDIYSSSYGINLEKYIGMPPSYVMSNLQKEIETSLLNDDRIIKITNFNCVPGPQKDILLVSFMISTIYGDVQMTGALNL